MIIITPSKRHSTRAQTHLRTILCVCMCVNKCVCMNIYEYEWVYECASVCVSYINIHNHLFYTHSPSVSLSHTHNWVDKKSVMLLLLVIAKSIAIWYGYIIALSRMIGYFWIIKLLTNKPSPSFPSHVVPRRRLAMATIHISCLFCKVTGQKIPQMNKH